MSKNAAFSDFIEDNNLLSNKRSISSGIPVQSEVSSISKHPLNLNINSSKTVDGKSKTAKGISENVIVCKKPAVITCTDSVNSQVLQEVENAEIQLQNDEINSIILNLCESVSETLNVNKIVAINTDENGSKNKSIETCQEVTKKSNKEVISAARTNFSARMTVSEDNNSLKGNKSLSRNIDQLLEYASAKPFKKSKGFYSSTPLASPSTHAIVTKKILSTRAFSPVLQKGLFTTSTPARSSNAVSAQQNHVCNVSRISHLERQCNSLQDLSIGSSVKLQRCPSTKVNLSMIPRRNKSLASFISSSQNTHHTSRSCISFSRREHLALGESRHCSKSWSSIKDAGASTSSECCFDSTLSKLLEFCGQTRIIPFGELYNWSHTTVRKIGEGTYGEVFTLVQNKISSVIKVIPFSEESGGNDMQSIESVLSEATVSKCLSELRNNKNFKTRNFNKLKSVHLVQGYYPDQMLVAWDKFSNAKTTYNSRPDVFNDQQMFAIIELEYGGKDMTCFILRNAAEAESVLKQIAISLAIAEEAHLFEHRDLHLGNILVQRNASKTISYVLRGKAYSIPNHGLVVTIIDFTLSRVLHEGCIFYNDLADDDSLFNQTGDYQFQIYKDTKQLLNNEWHKCLLYSNVLWLTFLCVKLLEYDYSRPSSKKHEEGLNKIRTFQNNLRQCQNAFECLASCNVLTSIPKGNQGSAKQMAKKAKLVDRKSLQKSISHRVSNVA